MYCLLREGGPGGGGGGEGHNTVECGMQCVAIRDGY